MTTQQFLNARARIKRSERRKDDELLVALQQQLGIMSQRVLAAVLDMPEASISTVMARKTRLTRAGRAYVLFMLYFFAPTMAAMTDPSNNTDAPSRVTGDTAEQTANAASRETAA